MNNIDKMYIFACVVEAGGFSGAARRLGVGKSAVSMQISRLEEQLGVRLLNRTTRRVSLTEAGESYYQSCARIMEEAELANEQILNFKDEVSGLLRLSCPVGLGNRVLVPAVQAFLDQYPMIKIEMDFSDRDVDLAAERFDVAIRVAELSDSSLIARKLAEARMVLVASPDYLAQQGYPQSLEDLESRQWVLYSHVPERLEYHFNDQHLVINTQGRIKVNNEAARVSLTLAGQGLALMPVYDAWDAIQDGELEVLFPQIPLPAIPVSALYLNRKFLPAKTTAFLDFLQQYFRQLEWVEKGEP